MVLLLLVHTFEMETRCKQSLVLVSAIEADREVLTSFLDERRWSIRVCKSIADAQRCLSSSIIVICDQLLPDGDWRVVLSILRALPATPLLIVMSRLADDALWAEVLNCGGYDVISKPLARADVIWVLQSASNMVADKARTRPARTSVMARQLLPEG